MIFRRMLRAAKLEAGLYEEVEADKGATVEALGAVLFSSLAAGIGISSTGGGSGFIAGTLGALAGWAVWAFLTFFLGAKIFPEAQTKADIGELLRTIGFAHSPRLILLFGCLHPTLAGFLMLLSFVWTACAMVIAVRQALDYQSTGRAVAVVVVGGLIQLAVFVGLVVLIIGMSAGPGA